MESLMSSMSLVFFFFFGFSPFRFDQAVFLLSKGVRTIVVRKKEKKKQELRVENLKRKSPAQAW